MALPRSGSAVGCFVTRTGAPPCSRGVLTVPSRGSAAAPAARQHTRCTPGCRRVMFTVNVSLRRNITGQREEMKGKKRCQNDEMTWCNIEGNLPDPSNCTLGGGCGTDFRPVYHIKEVGWTQSRPRAQRTWTSDRALVLLIAEQVSPRCKIGCELDMEPTHLDALPGGPGEYSDSIRKALSASA